VASCGLGALSQGADAAVPKRCSLSVAPILCKIKYHRSETRRLQREMGVKVSFTKHRELQVEGLAFRLWVLALWKERHEKALARWKRFFAGWAAQERNVYRAIRASSNFWGVSYGWLVSCAQSEGIIGGVILYEPNYAGAAGSFQFLFSTWARMEPAAYRAARSRGTIIPARYRYWTSNVSQSWTAGWAFKSGLSHEWFGAGC
jgi:hypothetical protein